jgi:hypothetical protein
VTRAHPEGSILEDYTTEEVVECYMDYIKDGKWICLHIPLHKGRLRGRGRKGRKTFVDRDYSLVRHISVYYNSSRLLNRTSMNTCRSCKEITLVAQMPGL